MRDRAEKIKRTNIEATAKKYYGETLLSLFYIAIGIGFLFVVGYNAQFVTKTILTVTLIGIGCFDIIHYLRKKHRVSPVTLISGALILALGIYLYRTPMVLIQIMPGLIGALIIVDDVWVIQRILRVKRIQRNDGNIFLIISAILGIAGLMLIINPFNEYKVMVIYAGCILIINGVFDFIVIVVSNNKLKKMPAENTEGETTTDIPMIREDEVEFVSKSDSDYSQSSGTKKQYGNDHDISVGVSTAMPNRINSNLPLQIAEKAEVIVEDDGEKQIKSSQEKLSVTDTSHEDTPVDARSVEDVTDKKVSAKEASAKEVSAEEIPANEYLIKEDDSTSHTYQEWNRTEPSIKEKTDAVKKTRSENKKNRWGSIKKTFSRIKGNDVYGDDT